MSAMPPEEQEIDLHGPYDPELPFLYALEREVTRRARRAQELRESKRLHAATVCGHTTSADDRRRGAAPDGRWRGHGRRRRRGAPAGARVARRSLTLVALLCLIGASAFGAGHILSTGPSNPATVTQSAFAQVAAGSSGPDHWMLRTYTRGNELCRVLVVGETESSRCSSPPRAGAVGVTSVLSPTRRYVYGVTGPGVARVLVRAGTAAAGAPTHSLDAGAVGLPHGLRWFILVLRRPVGEPDPQATVRGVNGAGGPTGRPVSDCAEATEAQLCPR